METHHYPFPLTSNYEAAIKYKNLDFVLTGPSHNNTSPFDFSATCSEVTCELRPKSDWNKQTSPLLEFHPLKLLSAQNGTGSTDLFLFERQLVKPEP